MAHQHTGLQAGSMHARVDGMADTKLIWNESSWAVRILTGLALAASLIGVWARFRHLGYIETPIFDEVYFPIFANAFLHHKIAFDVHPPLGKFFLAIGIYLFGDTPFGWRIVPACFGLLNVGLLLAVWRSMNGGQAGFSILLSLAALDGSLIVYSRTGLLDGLLLSGILLCVWLAWQSEHGRSLLPLTLALGMVCAIKWIGLGVLVPVL